MKNKVITLKLPICYIEIILKFMKKKYFSLNQEEKKLYNFLETIYRAYR